MMSGAELFTEAERNELRKVLGEELRVLGMLDLPARADDSFLPAFAVDDEAEEQLIALAEVGQVAKVSPKAFGRPFHGLLFLVISTCWQSRKRPTLNRVMWVLRKEGWADHVEHDVRRLLLETPVRMTPNVAIRRVVEAQRRRQMHEHIRALDVLLRDVHTPAEPIAKELQKLIEVARGR